MGRSGSNRRTPAGRSVRVRRCAAQAIRSVDAHVIAPVVARRAPRRRTAVPSTVPTIDRELANQPVHPLTPSSVRVLGFALAARRTGTTSEHPGPLISSDRGRRAGRGPIT